MGYEIHIRRRDGQKISLEEWCDAVTQVPGIRPAITDAFARNPQTGEKIRIQSQPGDIEVYMPDVDAWVLCLWYSQDRISFKADPNFLDPDSPIRQAVIALVGNLDNVEVVGDEGEVYA